MAAEATSRTIELDVVCARTGAIVAEGIETADLLEAVLELRFDAGQGYLLGRLLPHLVHDPVALFALMADGDQTIAVA